MPVPRDTPLPIDKAEEEAARLFGARLRELRRARDVTQEDLARPLGVTQTAISYWEAGKRQPSLSVLDGLAVMLNADLNWLIRGQAASQREGGEG